MSAQRCARRLTRPSDTEKVDAVAKDGPAVPPEKEQISQEELAAARARELKAGSLRAHGKRTLALKARQNKDLLGLDGTPVFEGWTVGSGQKQKKPVGKPRGKSAAAMSATELEAAKERAEGRRAAAHDAEQTYELCATYTCDLCSEHEFSEPTIAFPDGCLQREKGEALTSFPQGLIAHRTGRYSCVRRSFQTIGEQQAKRARQPRSEAGRTFQARYNRDWAFAEGVPARTSGKAVAAGEVAAEPKVDGRKRKAAQAAATASANTKKLHMYFTAHASSASAPAAADEPEPEPESDMEWESWSDMEPMEPESEPEPGPEPEPEAEPEPETAAAEEGPEQEIGAEEESLLPGFDDSDLADMMM
jgi:hypothetical protein